MALHEAHPGIVRMKALARSYVWWPGMDAEIESWVRRCQTCQEVQPNPPSAPAQSWESTHKPWSQLHLDFAGPFQGLTFLITVDSYSKWLEVSPVSTTSTKAVIRCLRRLFATHGLPNTIVSDNGTAFTSAEYLRRNLIRHIRSAPFHPATNSQAERMVRTAKEALSWISEGDWEFRLAQFLLTHRTTPNPVTGHSPAKLLMGRRPTTLLDRLHPDRAPNLRGLIEQQEPSRGFFPRDPVFLRNYGLGPPWITGRITGVKGPTSYKVSTEAVGFCRDTSTNCGGGNSRSLGTPPPVDGRGGQPRPGTGHASQNPSPQRDYARQLPSRGHQIKNPTSGPATGAAALGHS
ncbi:PREDICTED: uncharacterized protein K02A2.6-like [Gekko japonicus]|uniref:Gypsy retrotransposon integrase-like protein 1 n=1 Tax=Gekko japonicus TaxID=146911 RepID=A0ABM1JZ36_GEKJA|nr:PREDICTED: uncharacterized protein K02A2.6-like [Gekko japonicus]